MMSLRLTSSLVKMKVRKKRNLKKRKKRAAKKV